jgi:hypothetical protein
MGKKRDADRRIQAVELSAVIVAVAQIGKSGATNLAAAVMLIARRAMRAMRAAAG